MRLLLRVMVPSGRMAAGVGVAGNGAAVFRDDVGSEVGSFGRIWACRAGGYRRIELVGGARRSAEDWRRILAHAGAEITVDATSGIKAGLPIQREEHVYCRLKGFLPAVQRLGCGQIILLSGKRIDGAAPGVQRTASIEH